MEYQSALGQFTGFLKPLIKIKKNSQNNNSKLNEKSSFLFYGGEFQQLYEQFRSIALNKTTVISINDKIGYKLFMEYGMTLFMAENSKTPVKFWNVSRTRASVRGGDFSLKDLLLNLGIANDILKAS